MNALRRAINCLAQRNRVDCLHAALRELSDTSELRQSIDRIATEARAERFDSAELKRNVLELPEQDRAILLAYKSGKTRATIATEFGLEESFVLESLARSYATLRMKTGSESR